MCFNYEFLQRRRPWCAERVTQHGERSARKWDTIAIAKPKACETMSITCTWATSPARVHRPRSRAHTRVSPRRHGLPYGALAFFFMHIPGIATHMLCFGHLAWTQLEKMYNPSLTRVTCNWVSSQQEKHVSEEVSARRDPINLFKKH